MNMDFYAELKIQYKCSVVGFKLSRAGFDSVKQ